MSSTNDNADIENFYYDRIQNFDEERQKITKYINLIKPNQRELHILQWENRQEIENATISNHELLGYKRDLQNLYYQIDGAKLELQNLNNKHIITTLQIQKLSELSQPVQRDVTYLFDDKYSYTAPASNNNNNISNNTHNNNNISNNNNNKLSSKLIINNSSSSSSQKFKHTKTNQTSHIAGNILPPQPPHISIKQVYFFYVFELIYLVFILLLL